jgi:hypothetical protein
MIHTYGWSYKGGSAGTVNGSTSIVGTNEENLSEVLIANGEYGPTAQIFPLTTDTTKVQGIFLFCSQNLVVKTNTSDGSTGIGDTITLTAGVPVIWISGNTANCPFTVNVTQLYVENIANTTADFEVRTISNS